MAACRVYLPTYRRPDLLKRALESLVQQTLTDWVCEIHNDDPIDELPGQIAATFQDSRIRVVNHARNLGPTRTFNLMYRAVNEPYIALLEDDNWWEPEFLETMLSELDAHPDASLAWANMQIHSENVDGSWTDTGRAIWNGESDSRPRLYFFPVIEQVNGAIHSNGAMVVRTAFAAMYSIPDKTTFAAVEPVRERVFIYPILFVPGRLANFSVTRSTARDRDASTWLHIQALLIASFVRHVPIRAQTMLEIWSRSREGTRATTPWLLCALTQRGCFHLLSKTRLADWYFFARWILGRPRQAVKTFERLLKSDSVADFLDVETRKRAGEAAARGFEAL